MCVSMGNKLHPLEIKHNRLVSELNEINKKLAEPNIDGFEVAHLSNTFMWKYKILNNTKNRLDKIFSSEEIE